MQNFKFNAYDTVGKKMIEWDELKHMPNFFENPTLKISQYIGYNDKNNNEIYTNDIVEWKGLKLDRSDMAFRHTCVVTNDNTDFCGWALLSLGHIKAGYVSLGRLGANSTELTKIGNIFINPELLDN